jgi:hypothetical protein
MNRKAIIPVIAVLIIILFIKFLAGREDVLYSNGNGTFTFDEDNVTGRDYKLCIRNFAAYKAENKHDTILYRLTPKEPYKFWRWIDYLSMEKYRLPFKDWRTIEAVRGPVENKTNWQAF